MPMPLRIAVLISGGGTTLQNLIDKTTSGQLPIRIVGVVSSRGDVGGVLRAAKAGLPVVVVPKADGLNPTLFAEGVWGAIRGFAPDLICLAGWLHLLPIPEEFRLKVLNVHPSLLPSFGGRGMYGRRVHEAVLKYGAKVSGCTVHFADDSYDTGPIVAQRCVPVHDGDDPDTLALRVFAAECEAYPVAIQSIAEGRVTVEGRCVRVSS